MRAPHQHRTRQGQAGFTLIELMLSIVLIGIMFLGLGVALMGAMAGAADSRRNQQSADVLAELTESARSVDYASLAVIPPGTGDPVLTSDSAITYSSGTYYADVNGSESGGVEPMLIDAAGTVTAQQTLERDGTPYTVFSYVTLPSGATNYKRLTTVVQWRQAGLTHSRRSSTYIAETQRGLPLPDFVFKSAMTTLPGGDSPTFDGGSSLDLFLSLTNRGARDAWTITATGKSWSWEYNQATGPDTSSLTSLSGGVTPSIATDGSMFVNVHVDSLPVTSGGPYAITVRATSVAQPTVYKEVTFQVSIANTCVGCTFVPLYLHNTTTSAGCTGTPCTDPSSNRVTTDLYADLVTPKWPNSLPDFDKNVTPTGPGRWLLNGGNIATETTTTGKLMQWRWDPGSTLIELKPGKNMKLLFCTMNTNSASSPEITWQVLAQKSSGAAVAVTSPHTTSINSDSSVFHCDQSSSTVLSPPSGTTWPMKGTGSNYRKLFLRVVTPASNSIETAYDTTTYAAVLNMPTP